MERMVKASIGEPHYYYAGGKKITLAPADDLIAVDMRALSAGLPKLIEAALRKSIRPLSGEVGLINRADLGSGAAAIIDALEKAGATHPVFRVGETVLIVLPEVRVEESRPGAKQKSLSNWLASHSHEAVVKSRDHERVVLEPASGYGGDALTLANQLAEQVGPEMAQARFLRIMPGPSIFRR
jgi:hypothetical protein